MIQSDIHKTNYNLYAHENIIYCVQKY